MCLSRRLALALLFLVTPVWSLADQRTLAAEDPFMATVVGVTERNSLVVETETGRHRQIALAYLTIPIGDQAYADRANEILRHQLSGRRVSVRPIVSYSGDYTEAVIYVKTNNFNIDMVHRGHAWVDFYHRNTAAYLNAQRSAVANRRGLYADPKAKHPAVWKTEKEKAEKVVAQLNSMASDPAMERVLTETYVGHREKKEFLSTGCVTGWADWDWSERTVITSLAGAAAKGYKQIECE